VFIVQCLCYSHSENKVLCSEYSVCFPVIPWIKYCVHSTVFVFQLFHDYSIVFRVQCLCSSHSVNKVLCSEYSVCVTVTPRIHSCVQSRVFVFQTFHEYIIIFGTRCLCSSHLINTVLCTEYNVCVQFILWIQYRYCVLSTVYSSRFFKIKKVKYIYPPRFCRRLNSCSRVARRNIQ